MHRTASASRKNCHETRSTGNRPTHQPPPQRRTLIGCPPDAAGISALFPANSHRATWACFCQRTGKKKRSSTAPIPVVLRLSSQSVGFGRQYYCVSRGSMPYLLNQTTPTYRISLLRLSKLPALPEASVYSLVDAIAYIAHVIVADTGAGRQMPTWKSSSLTPLT